MQVRPPTPEEQRDFDEHYPKLVAYLERMLGRRDVAEDVAQEAYLRVYPSSGDKPHWKAVLYTTARHLAISWMRHDKVRARPREDVELLASTRVLGSTLDALMREELHEKLEQIITELQPSLQEPVRLRYQQGMCREEAARNLCISIGALEQRTTRAIGLIRQRLQALFGSSPS